MANDNEKTEKKAEKKDAPAQKKSGGKKGKDGSLAGDLKITAAGQLKVSPEVAPRLQTMYQEKIAPALVKQLGFSNVMQVPRLDKIVVNCAVKEAVSNPKVLDNTLVEIMAITGQKAVLTRSKKAIAAFKVRKGNAVGVRVTLRRARMYEFFDRLVNITLPRVRDFKGVNTKAFDGRGNYSLGLKEQIIFPEINYDKVDQIRGMTITVVTTAKKNEHARALLTELGMPFKK